MAINIGTTGSAGRFVGGEHIYRSGETLRLYLDPYKYECFTGETTSTIYDLSYENNDLVLVNGAKDRANGHWDFDGTDDFAYITDANMSDLDVGTSDFTVQWWQYLDSDGSMFIMMKGSASLTGYNIYQYNGTMRVRLSGALINYVNEEDISWDGSWMNVAVSVDRGTKSSLYKNGILIQDDYATPGSTSENVSNYFYIGGSDNGVNSTTAVSNEVNGRLGPILFYKGIALSHDAIRQNFNVHRGLYGV